MRSHLKYNLVNPMPWIVCAPEPLLVAAQARVQTEFDCTFRSIVREKSYKDRKIRV